MVGCSGYPQRAFLWTPEDGMLDLGTLAGWGAMALGINDHDQVVGGSDARAFLWSPSTGMLDIGDIEGTGYAWGAFGINNSGVIVANGSMCLRDDCGCVECFGWGCWRRGVGLGFRGPAGGLHHLPTIRPLLCGGTEHQAGSMAFAINDAGSAVGYSQITIDNIGQCNWATVWPASGGFFLPAGERCSEARDINNHGSVVGLLTDTRQHFLWTPLGGLRNLGSQYSGQLDVSVNDHDEVAATLGEGFQTQAFVWSSGRGARLLPDSGWGSGAFDINNRGQVVGFVHDRYWLRSHAVLWSPGNQAPEADAGGPYTGREGAELTFDGRGSTDPDGDPLTFAWDFGDGATGYDGATLIQAETYHADGSFTDPGADTWTASVNWGDAAGPGPLALAGKAFALSHTYKTPGAFTLVVVVTDDDGGVGESRAAIRVRTPAEGAAVLAEAVDALAARGLLGQGNARALKAKLEAAIAALERGNKMAAANQLGAFILHVEALARGGQLDATSADGLIGYARRILAALSKP